MAKRASSIRKKQDKKRPLNDELNSATFKDLEELGSTEVLEPEDVPRHFKTADDEAEEGLPIIVNGEVKRTKRRKTESSKEDESASSDESEDDEQPGVAQPEEPAYVELSSIELKERIALFADLIISEPEEHINKLRDLVEHAERTKKTRTRQLLLLSLTTIFKDVIPGYNIKELTELQRKEKVSKEVRQLRDFEQGLLSAYKRFVHLIHHSFRQSKNADELSEHAQKNKYVLGCTAIEAACDLVESVPHFNYRHELVVTIVDKLASQRVDQTFLRCIECINALFRQDEEGHVSFEAVQALTRMIKSRRYKVDSRVLGVFLQLRLLTELQGRADLDRLVKTKPQSIESELHLKKKDRVHLTKTQRKARKEQKEVDEEMRKAELGVSSQVRERLQAQTLKLVFVLYMNVLKLRAKNLLGATLEGLAKFAHLVNAELYGDLLEVLRELLVTNEAHNTRQSLLCILTAFQLLKGQGHGLEKGTDLGFFVDQLYKTLGDMALNPLVEQSHRSLQTSHAGKFASETDMMVRCLELLFINRRGASKTRLLAFTKRLAECSLQFPERSCLISLKVMRQIVKQHPEAAALLSIEDRIGRGSYNSEAEVPEQANAEVATIWEIALLRQHYDPRVQEATRVVRN